ncbi:acid-sensing ion channel 2-like isoform X1 [Montipora foliosa]|uniref:acid-sensing ion channel 2-like isoform X1 n=1 Tax=Montipora foliosa TaxID=591990 RepID=UPI0035F2165F
MTDDKRERTVSFIQSVAGYTNEKPADLSPGNEQSLSSSHKDNPNEENGFGMPTETSSIGAHFEHDHGVCEANEKIPTWKDFSNYVTLHGFHYIFEGRRLSLARVTWLLLLIIFTGYVVYSLCCSIIKYFDYPIATVLRIEYPVDNMPFPAVTLCPLTTITNSKASMKDDHPSFNKLGLNIDACKATAAVRAGRPCGEALLCCCANIVTSIRGVVDNCTEEYRNELTEALKASDFSFNNRDFFRAFGPNMNKMIIPRTCEFGSLDKRCSHNDFVPVFTDDGICYSFNSEPGEKVLSVSYGDITGGLVLMLDLRVDDHLYGLISDGVRILVHNQGEYVNPWNGVLVAPGTHAQISVTRNVYRNKMAPYETNCDDSKRLASFQTYTSEGCFYECISNMTFEACKCRAIGVSGNSDDRVCFRQDDECVYQVITDLFDGVLDNTCVCPMACDVVSYETTVSTASFPNPSMIKILRNSGYNKTKDYFRENLVYLQIGYKSFSYNHHRQKAQYDSGALLGEIGGNLGLFLGCSILTICEFVHFIIYICYIRHKKKM